MIINGTNYTIDDLRRKMPKYGIFFVEKVQSGSHEDKLDKNPIATTQPNLHMRYNSSQVIRRGANEVAERKYHFLGRIGIKIYSCCHKFIHEDTEGPPDDSDRSEVP